MRPIASDAALAAAVAAHGRSIVTAPLDACGDLLAYVRAGGVFPASVGIARGKACTAMVFRTATDLFGKTLGRKPLRAAGIARRLGVVAGGLPILRGDTVIGSIEVSGGSDENDVACAEAGPAVLDAATGSGVAANQPGRVSRRARR